MSEKLKKVRLGVIGFGNMEQRIAAMLHRAKFPKWSLPPYAILHRQE